MPGSMWDMGAPPQSAPQDVGTHRTSMWDQGQPGPTPSSQPSQSMWDQGAPRPTSVVQPMNRPPAPVPARPTQAPLMGPQGPLTGNIKKGTVKSYSVVKGFGFILAPDIPQDIYFGRDSLQADLRTSDVAGTQVTFELIRAPDGKPQGRNLRPIGNAPPTAAQMQHSGGDGNADGRGCGGGFDQQPRPTASPGQSPQGCWPGKGMMGAPPMNPMGMQMGGCFPGKGGGCINPAFLGKPGFPPMNIPAGAACFQRPSYPMMPNQMQMGQTMPGGMMRPGMAGMAGGMMRPGMQGAGMLGQPGMMMNGKGNRQRDWSPHAGSRAIRSAIKPASEAGSDKEGGPPRSKSKSKSSSRSRSRSRSRSSSSSKSRSRSRSRKKKKKKKKKKHKKKKGRSSSTISSSSSGGKNKDKSGDPAAGDSGEAGASGENPEVQKAKMEALAKLQSMQSVEPKEERSKQFRALLREWHPDKNPEKAEVATAVFQFLQKGKNLLNLK